MNILNNIIRYLVEIFNVAISTFIISLCLIFLFMFDTWQEKIIAIVMTFCIVYVFTLCFSKILSKRINVSSGVFELLSGPLLIVGSISCISMLDLWPAKVVGMFVWIVIILFLSSVVGKTKK
ncbi:hypothetical protein [Trabulsiella odontotermitis]|uniref:hypothetical protein n=1 Tax=Trabulsiella odontotermitis TaxID=379893 RepID=UPI0009BB4534|nr:hypothetical protein [Trabulsiella odontotermitis]